MTNGAGDPPDFRLLRRLTRRGAALRKAANGWRLTGAGRAAHPVDPFLPMELKARGLVAEDGSDGLAVTAEGRAYVRRRLAGNDGFAEQHQERAAAIEGFGEDSRPITINLGESPLAVLRRRRLGDGSPAIDAAEFAAGERLRSDFERGQLMPRVTADWSSVARNRVDGTSSARTELSDVALDARRRVEAALDAVGPDFAGLLIDFCCFLIGIEALERARRWPTRSAKLVLRLALASLARHYGLAATARGAESARIRHWGADDYRPNID
jgi:hypothetical protein